MGRQRVLDTRLVKVLAVQTQEDDPERIVTTLWNLEGQLICVLDPEAAETVEESVPVDDEP
jgi:hypothetical protein